MISHPTTATLKVGNWSFTGYTRSDRLTYLPASLQRALGDVPSECRSPYHGKCSEIAALAKALRSTANLNGAKVKVSKIRRVGNPKNRQAMQPCTTCREVLKHYGVKW